MTIPASRRPAREWLLFEEIRDGSALVAADRLHLNDHLAALDLSLIEFADGALQSLDACLLEFGVVTARNPADWARLLARIVAGQPDRSPFVRMTRGRCIQVRFSRPFPVELDGGDRDPVRKLRIRVHPASVQVCVPPGAGLAHQPGPPPEPDGARPA